MRVKELVALLSTMDGDAYVSLKGPGLHLNQIQRVVAGDPKRAEGWVIIHYNDDYVLNLQKAVTGSEMAIGEDVSEKLKKKNMLIRIEHLEMKMREMYAMQSEYRNWKLMYSQPVDEFSVEETPIPGRTPVVPVVILRDQVIDPWNDNDEDEMPDEPA